MVFVSKEICNRVNLRHQRSSIRYHKHEPLNIHQPYSSAFLLPCPKKRRKKKTRKSKTIFSCFICWHERVEFVFRSIYKCICFAYSLRGFMCIWFLMGPYKWEMCGRKKKKAPREEGWKISFQYTAEHRSGSQRSTSVAWRERKTCVKARAEKMNGEIIGLSGFSLDENVCIQNVDKRTRERFTDSSVCFFISCCYFFAVFLSSSCVPFDSFILGFSADDLSAIHWVRVKTQRQKCISTTT